MKINIIIPFIPFKPGGGLKVMFEYANHLSRLGHQVTLYYPIKVAYIKQSLLKMVAKYVLYNNNASTALTWFKLDNNIEVRCIFSINDNTIKNGDIVFSTWWSLMFEIKKLSADKGRVFNLIQDVEDWFGFKDQVKLSYTIADAVNVVISNHLCKYISDQTGKKAAKVPIAVDDNIFYIKTPYTTRDRYSVCMLYSIERRKGSVYGLQALNELKKRYPLLKVTLFSVADRPADIPDWMEYHKSPGNLRDLYNAASIFISPSLQEGCALPPMEAMHCGNAVICTDIEGHKEYGINGETVIFVQPCDVNDMVEKVSQLIENDELRLKIAKQGATYIKGYNWSASALKMEALFNNGPITGC